MNCVDPVDWIIMLGRYYNKVFITFSAYTSSFQNLNILTFTNFKIIFIENSRMNRYLLFVYLSIDLKFFIKFLNNLCFLKVSKRLGLWFYLTSLLFCSPRHIHFINVTRFFYFQLKKSNWQNAAPFWRESVYILWPHFMNSETKLN